MTYLIHPRVQWFRNLAKASLAVAAFLLGTSLVNAAEWLTAPSYYTHDSSTGQRVTQYAQVGPFYYYFRPDYMKSGYRHTRSTIQLGGSADNLHIVEEWGRPVQPYEQWRFPYRPYSVPYNAWGPQVGLIGGYGPWGGGYPGMPGGGGFPGGYPGGYPAGAFPGTNPYNTPNVPQQMIDGYYPSYNRHDRSDYYQPYGGFHPGPGGGGPGGGPGPTPGP